MDTENQETAPPEAEHEQAPAAPPVTFESIAVDALTALVDCRDNAAHREDIVARAIARVDALGGSR